MTSQPVLDACVTTSNNAKDVMYSRQSALYLYPRPSYQDPSHCLLHHSLTVLQSVLRAVRG